MAGNIQHSDRLPKKQLKQIQEAFKTQTRGAKELKLKVLKTALELIDHKEGRGICFGLYDTMRKLRYFMPVRQFLTYDVGMSLPPAIHSVPGRIGYYCWTLTPQGDAARRRFLQKCLNKVKRSK